MKIPPIKVVEEVAEEFKLELHLGWEDHNVNERADRNGPEALNQFHTLIIYKARYKSIRKFIYTVVLMYLNNSVGLFGLSDPLFTSDKLLRNIQLPEPPPRTTVSVVGCFNDGS